MSHTFVQSVCTNIYIQSLSRTLTPTLLTDNLNQRTKRKCLAALHPYLSILVTFTTLRPPFLLYFTTSCTSAPHHLVISQSLKHTHTHISRIFVSFCLTKKHKCFFYSERSIFSSSLVLLFY